MARGARRAARARGARVEPAGDGNINWVRRVDRRRRRARGREAGAPRARALPAVPGRHARASCSRRATARSCAALVPGQARVLPKALHFDEAARALVDGGRPPGRAARRAARRGHRLARRPCSRWASSSAPCTARRRATPAALVRAVRERRDAPAPRRARLRPALRAERLPDRAAAARARRRRARAAEAARADRRAARALLRRRASAWCTATCRPATCWCRRRGRGCSTRRSPTSATPLSTSARRSRTCTCTGSARSSSRGELRLRERARRRLRARARPCSPARAAYAGVEILRRAIGAARLSLLGTTARAERALELGCALVLGE